MNNYITIYVTSHMLEEIYPEGYYGYGEYDEEEDYDEEEE